MSFSYVDRTLRHSYTTRLLYSVMPASWYAKSDKTLDALNACMARNLVDLFHNGIEIEAPWLFSLTPTLPSLPLTCQGSRRKAKVLCSIHCNERGLALAQKKLPPLGGLSVANS